MSESSIQHDGSKADGLERYCALPRGAWRIAVLALVFSLMLLSAGVTGLFVPVAQLLQGLQGGDHHLDSISRMIFLFYMCGVAAMWSIYLMSRHRRMQVQSLRQLLLLNSVSWGHCDSDEAENHVRETREKARTTITVAAILVAASALVISQINAIHIALEASAAVSADAAPLTWQRFLLAMGYMCATGAFVALIVSVDALDCLFNHFSRGRVPRRNPTQLVRYFYTFTLNPKYIGLFLLLTSVVFVLAYFNANVGSLALAVMLTLGYAHWFPLGRLNENGEPELGGHTPLFRAIATVLYLVPGGLLMVPQLLPGW